MFSKQNKSKTPVLLELLEEEKIFIAAITETHLKPCVKNAEFLNQNQNYNVLRTDRISRVRGGVALITHHSLSTTVLVSHSTQYCEVLTISIDELQLLITVIYRPPICPKEQKHFPTILEKVNEVLSNSKFASYTSVILGDFNFPFIKWTPTQN